MAGLGVALFDRVDGTGVFRVERAFLVGAVSDSDFDDDGSNQDDNETKKDDSQGEPLDDAFGGRSTTRIV